MRNTVGRVARADPGRKRCYPAAAELHAVQDAGREALHEFVDALVVLFQAAAWVLQPSARVPELAP
jgi:hypothetical protein|tara:strand:+ start:240 stop:437 length:198 start_codon:yes stop_codon:yes gene_type:complete